MLQNPHVLLTFDKVTIRQSLVCICFLLNLSLIFSLLIFLFSDLLSAPSLLCFSSVHIVGSLTSKLPSNSIISSSSSSSSSSCCCRCPCRSRSPIVVIVEEEDEEEEVVVVVVVVG